MDAQRASYKSLTLSDETGVPNMLTKFLMEHNASTVYTNKKFYEVQEEIVAAVNNCVTPSMHSEGDVKIYEVDDGSGSMFKVSYDLEADLFNCGYKLFVRRSIPCRYMIHGMRTRRLNKIPDKYILKRWSKLSKSGMFSGDQLSNPDPEKLIISNQHFFSKVCRSIVSVRNNTELQGQLLSDLKALSDKFAKLRLDPDVASSKKNMFEVFYGCKIPERIEVGTPDVASTKGSGASGRIKSYKEKSIEAKKKNLRNCRSCNRLVDHDSRNCNKKQPQVSDS